MASGVWAACAANSSGKVADGIARAVSFQPRRMMARSSGARISRLPIARSGSATAASSRRTSRPDERLDAGAVEQVGGIFHHPADPRRRAVRSPLLAQAHRQVELRARGRHTLEAAAQSIELELHLGGVLQRQHHLEQRMPRQRPRRVDDLHQPLERQILVAVGREVARTNPRHQLPEARIARRVGAQHQGVDEEPDQVVERAVGAARDRAADRDVAASPQPRQQRRKAGLQHHEQARAARPRKLQKACVQLRRQLEG